MELQKFIQRTTKSGGHIEKTIKTAKGNTMVYYKIFGSYPTDIRTKTF